MGFVDIEGGCSMSSEMNGRLSDRTPSAGRGSTEFRHVIQLPPDCDTTRLSVEVTHGVLVLRAPLVATTRFAVHPDCAAV
ncbi:MAG TPA: Hsp20/alpha crystallin family protein [Gaiellaceae bacterium]|jgi:hypothetical protein